VKSSFPPDWVAAHALATPDSPAVDSPDCRLTYGALHARVQGLAAALAARGATSADRVVIALQQSPAAAVASLAVQTLGACAVEIDRTASPDTLRFVLSQTGARFAVVAPQDARRWASLGVPSLAWIWVVGGRPGDTHGFPAVGATALARDGALAGEAADGPPPPRDVPETAPALIVYTSGSTGRPRGVIQTYRNLGANTRSIVEYLGLGPSDRAMAILPFHYCYGKSVLQTHLYVGGSVFVDPRFVYPRVVMEAIGTEGCTGFAGVPLTFELLRREIDVKSISMPRLRYLTQAGGPMRPDTVRWVRETFAPARLFVMYGQTEATARLAFVPPERGEEKLGSIGVAIPGVELAVVDEEGREVARDETGHLVARGDNVTPGYLDDPEETAAILRAGWLWTGDLARRDADGFFFLVGRAREIIKIGGNRVSPMEIEHVIAGHPAVAEAVVVGAPDPLQGEVAVAFVVPKAGAVIVEDDVRRFCRESLAAYKVPARIVTIDGLPKNAAGKPLRAELAAKARVG
jgi:acyl-CoA synthetase (AMP-forming)/AMP-acid ligase II